MEEVRREVDRVFRNVSAGAAPQSRVSFLPGRSARAYPLINLSEDNETLYVEALAPGVDPESLAVSIVRDQLVIAGEKSPLRDVRREAYHRSERAAGKFVRSLTLPVEVDENGVHAQYQNGLLQLALPKSERARPRQITVNVS